MSNVLKPSTERECLDWARIQEESADRYEGHGNREREAADCRIWAASWRRSASVAAERDHPAVDPRQQSIFDALEAL